MILDYITTSHQYTTKAAWRTSTQHVSELNGWCTGDNFIVGFPLLTTFRSDAAPRPQLSCPRLLLLPLPPQLSLAFFGLPKLLLSPLDVAGANSILLACFCCLSPDHSAFPLLILFAAGSLADIWLWERCWELRGSLLVGLGYLVLLGGEFSRHLACCLSTTLSISAI